MRTLAFLAVAGLLIGAGTASASAPHVVGKASGKTPTLVVAGLRPIANVSARATIAHPSALFVRIVATRSQKAEVLVTVSCDTAGSSSMKVKQTKIATGLLVPIAMPAATPDSCFVTADSVIRKGGSETAQILAS
jgi:hypothetical protein